MLAAVAVAVLAAILPVPWPPPPPAVQFQALQAPLTIDPGATQWSAARLRLDDVHAVADGSGVVVAVIDSGVAPHPEFAGRLLDGIDLVDGGAGTKDPNGHGTHVAGIVAAADDQVGTVGVAPGATILPVRVLRADGFGDDRHVTEGIRWAVANGADVINLSLGADSHHPDLEAAVRAAAAAGVVVVAAAGNGGASAPPMYPAAYDPVVAVAATTADDKPALFSQAGPHLDLAAPGMAIPAPSPGGTYTWMSGTSQAAPHVAGAAALLLQSGRSPSETVSVLTATAYGSGDRNRVGHGVVDPRHALGGQPTAPGPAPLPTLAPPSSDCCAFPTIGRPELPDQPRASIDNGPPPTLPDRTDRVASDTATAVPVVEVGTPRRGAVPVTITVETGVGLTTVEVTYPDGTVKTFRTSRSQLRTSAPHGAGAGTVQVTATGPGKLASPPVSVPVPARRIVSVSPAGHQFTVIADAGVDVAVDQFIDGRWTPRPELTPHGLSPMWIVPGPGLWRVSADDETVVARLHR